MKTDLTKTLDGYRARAGEFRLVALPPLRYLMVDGHGDPDTSPQYAAALHVLYPLAYALKFVSRDDTGQDYVVPPLEGLWWAPDMAAFTTRRDKTAWSWTMMLLTPPWTTPAHLAAARRVVAAKKPALPVQQVRAEVLDEGLCAQTLHIGPFDTEGDVLAPMHSRFIPEQDLVMVGRHHEIYLSDPRRTPPARRRTILRQPVQPLAGGRP